jgi:DNA-binding response OmpR family regulator
VGRKRFLLLIDDDPEICEIVTTALALEGLAVRTAFDAETGLELAGDDAALVLLDVSLPGMDPSEFVRRYRDRRGARAPIVVFSAAQGAEEFARSIAADGILVKPFELDELIGLAAQYLTAVAA